METGVYTFRNDFLKAEEEKDFLGRNEKFTESTIAKVRGRMGTISVMTNLHV